MSIKHLYGRRGGAWLDPESGDAAAAREAGLVLARCDCQRWLCTPAQVGEKCHSCGARMEAVE